MKKKFLCGLIALTTVFSAVGCNKNNPTDEVIGSGDGLQIRVLCFDGGVGSEWLTDKAGRFAELKKETVYKDGTKGVSFKIDKAMGGVAGMASEGYNIYFNEAYIDVRAFTQNGLLLSIDDIMQTPLTEYGDERSIYQKLNKDYTAMLTGADGKFYALPYYEWMPGLTYDVEVFDKYGFYLAHPDETDVIEYDSKYGKANFVGSKTAKKAVGSDGKSGTVDDGLPTSLEEFILLCAYMKSESVSPFQLSGMYPEYGNYLIESFWTSLSGYDKMRTIYDYTGELDAITGYSNEPLFEGIDYVKKPITQKITITETSNADRIYDSVERYYAMALLEIAQKEGWFSTDASTSSVSHTDAQCNFINNLVQNKPIGMLIEGTYWYKESERLGYFEDYYDLSNKDERRIAVMPLPTSLDKTVTSELDARKFTMMETGNAFSVINANIKNDEGLVKACKDFLRFMYTDKELSSFSKITGLAMAALDYEVTDEDKATFDCFKQSVFDIREFAQVMYSGSDSDKYFEDGIHIDVGSQVFKPIIGVPYPSVLAAIRAGKTTAQIYDATK